MTHTTATAENIRVETNEKKVSATDICFGILMGLASVAGVWGAASLLISLMSL